MSDLSDLLDRLKSVPLGPILDPLRDLHAKGGAPAEAARPGTSVLEASAGPLGPALDFLRRAQGALEDEGVAERSSRGLVDGGPELARILAAAHRARADEADVDPFDESDERLRDPPASSRATFRARERQLRRQETLTSRILDQMQGGASVTALPRRAPLQQELRILCPTSGRSGGRFVVRNELGRRARVQFRVQPLHAVPGSLAERARVTIEPSVVDLSPGESGPVRVGIDLRDAPRGAAEIEFVVDASAEGDLLHKLWLSVVVTDDEREGA